MQQDQTKPVLYVKHTCPFCFKVRVFLLEAGLSDRVVLREAFTEEEMDSLRSDLSSKVDDFSVPVAQFGDEYITDSDAIIDRFRPMTRKSDKQLPLFRAYVDGPFAELMEAQKS